MSGRLRLNGEFRARSSPRMDAELQNARSLPLEYLHCCATLTQRNGGRAIRINSAQLGGDSFQRLAALRPCVRILGIATHSSEEIRCPEHPVRLQRNLT
jgi:hypothetical protein